MEAMGVMTVFGERAKSIPMSSNKSIDRPYAVGRGRCRSGDLALDLAASAHPADHQLSCPRSGDPARRRAHQARDAKVHHVMSSSFGFGGQNVSLVMGREPA